MSPHLDSGLSTHGEEPIPCSETSYYKHQGNICDSDKVHHAWVLSVNVMRPDWKNSDQIVNKANKEIKQEQEIISVVFKSKTVINPGYKKVITFSVKYYENDGPWGRRICHILNNDKFSLALSIRMNCIVYSSTTQVKKWFCFCIWEVSWHLLTLLHIYHLRHTWFFHFIQLLLLLPF
jgi:hypothetical protein